MKHFTLSDNTVIKSTKQVAEHFALTHTKEKNAKADLELLKDAIKDNVTYDWYAYGITLKVDFKTKRFDKNAAIKMLREKGATEDEIDSLTVSGTTKRVELKSK